MTTQCTNQQSVLIGKRPQFAAHVHPSDRLEATLKIAVAHLDRVLNGCRNHAEQQVADAAAREFLSSMI